MASTTRTSDVCTPEDGETKSSVMLQLEGELMTRGSDGVVELSTKANLEEKAKRKKEPKRIDKIM